MAELSLTKKVFIVGATWFSLFFTGGTIFGYSALKQSLLENEVYRNLCPEDTPSNQFCSAQVLRLDLMFTLGSSLFNFCALPIGYLLDRFGLKVMYFSAGLCYLIGSLLFGFSNIYTFDGYIPAFILMGFANQTLFMTSMKLSNIFPSRVESILTFFNVAFSLSSIVFLIFRVINQANSSITFGKLFLGGCIGPIFVILTSIFLIPWKAFDEQPPITENRIEQQSIDLKKIVEKVDKEMELEQQQLKQQQEQQEQQKQEQRQDDQQQEQQEQQQQQQQDDQQQKHIQDTSSKSTLERKSINETKPMIKDPFQETKEEKEHLKKEIQSQSFFARSRVSTISQSFKTISSSLSMLDKRPKKTFHDLTIFQQYKTLPFWIAVTFISFYLLRINHFISSIFDILVSFSTDEQKQNQVPNMQFLYSILYAVAGLIFLVPIGYLVQKLKLHSLYIILCSLFLLVNIFVLIPNLNLQYATIIIFCIFIPFWFTVTPAFVSQVFGFKNFGKIYGTIVFIASFVNFLQYLLSFITLEVMNGNYTAVNASLLVVCTIGFAFPFYLLYRK